MLSLLTKTFDRFSKKLRERGILTEAILEEALREVRLALLQADVHFHVVKSFLAAVRRKAMGKEVLETFTPGQQVMKVVWQELCHLLGSAAPKGESFAFPTKIMLVGLQGTGKTTTAAKLARLYKRKGKQVLLLAADLKRPAAIDQLETLAREIEVPFAKPHPGDDLISAIKRGFASGQEQGADLFIIDTAGRTTAEPAMMSELCTMKSCATPNEILLVADAMTGQSAVHLAEAFHQKVGLSGVILTKMEGDARGGALLSICAVTGVPVRFIGVGEKVDAIEPFYPERMASRILGMGDILSVIEKAEKELSDTPVQKRLTPPRDFTLEDFREQFARLKKMGNIGHLLEMIPGVRGVLQIPEGDEMEKELRRAEAILNAMTPDERSRPDKINGSRRNRIARGSGTSVQEINQLLKRFDQAKKMLKAVNGKRGGVNAIGSLFSSIYQKGGRQWLR